MRDQRLITLLSWLARIYEVQLWEADKPRRLAIEMLASWPLMSMAIRPMLELASFFPIDRNKLFRLEAGALPLLPIHAQQLQRMYESPARSEEINRRMDYMAVRVLADVAAWASSKLEAVTKAELPENSKAMIIARLSELSKLNEFQKQFPFRVAGGYSNRAPDLAYSKEQAEPTRYEESPGTPSALFKDTLVLRLRFSGRGLVQLATDPDPTWDEVGCSGTHMLHAADGDRRFDGSLVWQYSDPERTILRDPRDKLPALGVNCSSVSLLVTDGTARAGYVPLQIMNSQGAVQTSGVQQTVEVTGFEEVMTLSAESIVGAGKKLLVDLLPKDGQRPFLNGLNHLVWQDGEPIDPFVLAVRTDPPATGDPGRGLLFQREIFNEGKPLLEMSPLQRQNSSRAPVGFEQWTGIPSWVMAQLSEDERRLMKGAGYPTSYLKARAAVLVDALEQSLGRAPAAPSQPEVDAIVSFAERMRLVSVPRSTTVAWLRYLLHYGHTVSGVMTLGPAESPILVAIRRSTGLTLEPTRVDDRNAPNARWFVNYTKGIMDTDALSALVYGELYLPVRIVGARDRVPFARGWVFPGGIRQAMADYACKFDHVFWDPAAKVDGKTRTYSLPDGRVLTETLVEQSGSSYRYIQTGFTGVSDCQGCFRISPADHDDLKLEWEMSFSGKEPGAIVDVLGALAGLAKRMTAAMQARWCPREATTSRSEIVLPG